MVKHWKVTDGRIMIIVKKKIGLGVKYVRFKYGSTIQLDVPGEINPMITLLAPLNLKTKWATINNLSRFTNVNLADWEENLSLNNC